MSPRDVHRERPNVAIPLEKVGVVGIRMPVSFASLGGKRVIITPVFQVFVDLPTLRRGIHASRSYEAIAEVFSEFVKGTDRIENLCAAISRRLLERHEEATRTEVRAKAEAIVERKTPVTRIDTLEPYTVFAKAVSRLNGRDTITRRMIGARVLGITACPCVKESLANRFTDKILGNGVKQLTKEQTEDLLNDSPAGTHMQRCAGSILMDSPEGYNVDLTDIIKILEDSFSAPTFELLKRPDEVETVTRAIGNARFVEDSIRYMAKGVMEAFHDLPDETRVFMKIRSAESIHKHDMVAMRSATLGELKYELRNGRARSQAPDAAKGRHEEHLIQ
nr:GTP cyclohydrolase MptA [Candidatus Njordarchaeota archaeon]